MIEQCEVNDRKEFQIQDFVKAMVQGESLLMNKLQQSLVAKEEYQIQYQECQINVQQHQNLPKNRYGLDEDAAVTIDVIEGQNLYRNQNPNEIPYVQITCGKQVVRTTGNVNIINQNKLFKWGELFTLPIYMGTEDIYIEVLSFNTTLSQNFIIGSCMIPIQMLSDQNKIDQDFQLYDTNKNILPGKIRLSIQFIHDEQLYYEEMQSKLKDFIYQLDLDLQDLESDLELIREAIYTQYIPGSNQEKWQAQNMIFVSKNQNIRQQYATVPDSLWITYALIVLLLLISIVENYFRYAMLDLLVAIYLIKPFWMNYFDKSQIKLSIVGLIFAIIFDLLCLWLFNRGLFSLAHRKDLINLESTTGGLYNFNVILTWISIILKSVLVVFTNSTKSLVININLQSLYAFGVDKFTAEGIHQNPFIIMNYHFQQQRSKPSKQTVI